MPLTGQNIYNSGPKNSRERSLQSIQTIRSGNAFKVPESSHARAKSDLLRSTTTNNVRRGNYFSGNASKKYEEKNLQTMQERAQRNAAMREG
jgi:hypothetical protein